MTDEEADRLLSALATEGFALPFMARSRDYVHPGSVGEERAGQLADLRRADAEAEAENRAALRRALETGGVAA